MSETPKLRFGWTTGSCATAASLAAFAVLCGELCPDPVTITLPRGERVAFALAGHDSGPGWASACVVKDAGDDPDVTHGSLVQAVLRPLPPGAGVVFRAGPGVGMVTRPGLPIPPGEPAINPVPRRMITDNLAAFAAALGIGLDVEVEIGIEGGAELALKTLNPRLGVVGGLSVLGTTGIVVPFSCAAWIDTIHRGIDVARAIGLSHVAGATGRSSEEAVQKAFGLPDPALIDMGDFVGGMLKYLRAHPVPRVTIAGGIGKLTKLAQGRLDLHSKRGGVDFAALAALAGGLGATSAQMAAIEGANTAVEALALAAPLDLALCVAERAWQVARDVLDPADIALDVMVFDPRGGLLAECHGRNRRG